MVKPLAIRSGLGLAVLWTYGPRLLRLRGMKRAATERLSPEDLLQRAMAAQSPTARARYAQQGLACPQRLDRTTHAMLLRQLYLAHFEQRHFRRALQIANQMLKLHVLPDVCHQDVARTLLVLGDADGAADHLRLASRIAPARRRAFHLWTLGSVLFLVERYDQACQALERAVRWSTTDRPLYTAHLALARLMRHETVEDLAELIDRLEEAPCGQGYGRFVLGLLCVHAGRIDQAQRYLKAFVNRTRAGRPAMALSLAGEVQLAEEQLLALQPPA